MKIEGNKKTSTEIGAGILDLHHYVQAGKQHGVEWFLIDQEDYARDPMDVANDNLKNLKKQFL
jgi:sugar phosphate isomerase/epimerase